MSHACSTGSIDTSSPDVDDSELRTRARQEAGELGPEPTDPRERWQWDGEWRGAVELLAGLAGYEVHVAEGPRSPVKGARTINPLFGGGGDTPGWSTEGLDDGLLG